MRERFPEAIAEIKRAQELDPLSLIIRHERGWSFCFARQYDEALKQSQKALELDPSFPPAWWMLGQGYPQKGIYDKAIAEFQSGLQLSGGDPLPVAVLGHAYVVAADRSGKGYQRPNGISKQRYFPPYFIALIYVGLNDKDQAFVWLEKALPNSHRE